MLFGLVLQLLLLLLLLVLLSLLLCTKKTYLYPAFLPMKKILTPA